LAHVSPTLKHAAQQQECCWTLHPTSFLIHTACIEKQGDRSKRASSLQPWLFPTFYFLAVRRSRFHRSGIQLLGPQEQITTLQTRARGSGPIQLKDAHRFLNNKLLAVLFLCVCYLYHAAWHQCDRTQPHIGICTLNPNNTHYGCSKHISHAAYVFAQTIILF
jgi:hypothetical protein